jgi:hypothetical protein
MVSFVQQSFYPWEKGPQYPLKRRLGVSLNQYGCCGEKKNLLPLSRIEPQFLGCPVYYPAAILTELLWLLIYIFVYTY